MSINPSLIYAVAQNESIKAIFKNAGAISDPTAKSLDVLGVDERSIDKHLLRNGLIKTADNVNYYADLDLWQEAERISMKKGVVIASVLIALIGLIFYFVIRNI